MFPPKVIPAPLVILERSVKYSFFWLLAIKVNAISCLLFDNLTKNTFCIYLALQGNTNLSFADFLEDL